MGKQKKLRLAPIEVITGVERGDIEDIRAFQFPVVYVNRKLVAPGHAALYVADESVWDCAIHWLIKKQWEPSLKISYSIALKKALEPLGELLWSTYRLCVECHQEDCEEANHYKRGSEWFKYVATELREISFKTRGNGKPDIVKRMRLDLAALKGQIPKNPYSQREFPHLHRLMEVALRIAGKDVSIDRKTHFEKIFLRRIQSDKLTPKGFFYALSGWATEFQNNPLFAVHTATPDYLEWQSGRGHHRPRASRNEISEILTLQGL